MAKTIVNNGDRTFDLHDAVEVDGKLKRRTRNEKGELDPKEKVVKRRLAPRGQAGSSIEALDEAEEKHLLSYRDLSDSATIVPNTDDKLKALEKERDALKARVADLEAQLPKGAKAAK